MSSTSRVIDIHTHAVPRAVAEIGPQGGEWYGIDVRENERGRLAFKVADHRGVLPWANFRHSPEDRIRYMDEHGIDMQVVSLSPALVQYRTDPAMARAAAMEFNDQMADWSRRWPGRFAGLAFLPLQDPDAAVAEVERAMTTLGLAGIAVHTHVNGTNWDHESLFPVLAAAERFDALVFIHPAQVRVRDIAANYHLRNMCGNPWETTIAVASLIFGGVLDRLPRLKVVLAHGGGYTTFAAGRFDHGYEVRPEAQTIERPPSEYLRRLHFDTITHSDDALRFVIGAAGYANVVLGSDYPADMGTQDPVTWISGIDGVPEEHKRAILGGNAERLLALHARA